MIDFNVLFYGHHEPTLQEMVESEVRIALAEPTQDLLAAQYREEQMYVGVGYVTQFLSDRGRTCGPDNGRPRLLRPSDIVDLDPRTVAEHVECDARLEAKAGVARTVGLVIQHARKIASNTASATQGMESIATASMPSMPPLSSMHTNGIARAASKSLYAVGVVIWEIMRAVRKSAKEGTGS